MKDILNAEVLKLRTLRLSWVLLAVALAAAAAIGVAGAAVSGSDAVDARDAVLGPAQLLWFLVVVVGVVATAGEFQHRTVRTTLLAAPQRTRVLAAKAVVAAATGAFVVAAGTAVTVLACTVTRAVIGESLPHWSAAAVGAAAGSVGAGAVWAVVAAALGVLTRSTAVALVTVLLWRFVAEGVLPVVTRSPGISRWTPSGAGDAVVGLGGSDRLAALPAAALLSAYAAAVLLAAGALFLRRDPA